MREDNPPTGPMTDPVGFWTPPKKDGEKPAEATEEIVKWAREQMSAAQPTIAKWRKQAEECDRFKASRVFDDNTLAALRRDNRPTAVFNSAQKWIRLISGLESESLTEVKFLPRDMNSDENAVAGDLATKAYEWAIQNCEGDFERSRAFEDLVVRGMGWTNTVLNRADDVSGRVEVMRIDGMEMLWDHNSDKANLADARWVARKRQIPLRDALARWPEHAGLLRSSVGTMQDSSRPGESTLLNEREAVPQDEATWPHLRPGMVEITEFQFREEIAGIYFFDPLENKDDWLEEKEFNAYREKYRRVVPKLRSAAQDESTDYSPELRMQLVNLPDDIDSFDRILMNRFKTMLLLGNRIISKDENGKIGPVELPSPGFSYNCMTGQWDDQHRYYYGFFKLLVDPQRYMVKFANQVMEILIRSSKGGVFLEEDSVENPKQFEDEYAKVGGVSWLRPGTISAGAIKEKAAAALPAGAIEMFQVCNQMLREVTGINPDNAMGMGANDQPAMTMRQRQTASYILLSSEFRSLRRYRICEARTVFAYLKLIADDRWVRVGGPFDSQAIQLIREPFFIDYDIVLDEGTKDPNVREQWWRDIMVLAPTLLRMGMWLPEFFDLAPFPASLKIKLKQAFEAQKQEKQALAEQGISEGGRGKPVSREENAARVKKIAAEAQLAEARAAKEIASLGTEVYGETLKGELKKKELAVQERGQTVAATKDITKEILDVLAALANRGMDIQLEGFDSDKGKPKGE